MSDDVKLKPIDNSIGKLEKMILAYYMNCNIEDLSNCIKEYNINYNTGEVVIIPIKPIEEIRAVLHIDRRRK